MQLDLSADEVQWVIHTYTHAHARAEAAISLCSKRVVLRRDPSAL